MVIADEYSYSIALKNLETGETTVVPGKKPNIVNGGGGNSNTYTVAFYDVPGSIYATLQFTKGEAVKIDGFPTRTGYIFDGWDVNLTAINANQQVNAKWINSAEHNNLFAMPTVYTTKDAQISLPLALCGKVDLCAFDIVVSYNSAHLEFVEFTDSDEDVLVNHDNTTGIIHLNFVSRKNISGEIDLCNLVFKVIGNENTQTSINIEVKEVIKLGNDGEFERPQSETKNSVVYIQ